MIDIIITESLIRTLPPIKIDYSVCRSSNSIYYNFYMGLELVTFLKALIKVAED